MSETVYGAFGMSGYVQPDLDPEVGQSFGMYARVSAAVTVNEFEPVHATGLAVAATASGARTRLGSATATGLSVDVVATSADDPYLDPVSGTERTALYVVERNGDRVAELAAANIESIGWVLNDHGTLTFSLPASDVNNALLKSPVTTEVQAWRGRRCIWWGVVTSLSTDSTVYTYTAQTLGWYLTKKMVGAMPRPQLLRNPGFEEPLDEGGWNFLAAPGSVPNEVPYHRRSNRTEPSINGERSLRLEGNTGKAVYRSENIAPITFEPDSAMLSPAAKRAISRFIVKVRDGLGDGAQGPKNFRSATLTLSGQAGGGEGTGAGHELATERAEAVEAYIRRILPSADTPFIVTRSDGRTGFRRVEVVAEFDQPAKGLNQYAEQIRTYESPDASREFRYLSMGGYLYIDDADRTSLGDPLATLIVTDGEGEKTVRQLVRDSETPLNRWVRFELTTKIDSKTGPAQVKARVHAINGVVFYDDITVQPTDGLFFDRDTPQHRIVKNLIEHAQDTEIGKTDLALGTGHRGETRETRRRHYYAQNRETIWDLLGEFPTLADGLDISIEHSRTERKVVSHFPRQGREHFNGTVFSYDSNITDYNVTIDGEETANAVVVMREGQGADKEEAFAFDDEVFDGDRFEKAYEATPGSSKSSLRAQARRGVGRYRRHVVTPSFSFKDRQGIRLRDLGVGDIVPTDLRHHTINHQGRVRITGITFYPNTETFTVDTVPWDKWSV